jgi:iron complex outermembrane receptor protein
MTSRATKISSVSAIALGVAAAISLPARAQTTPNHDDMDEVLVSARRSIDSGFTPLGTRVLRDTPFSVNSVGKEDIEKHQSASLAAVFAKDASVAREGGTDYNLYAQRLSVRGLTLDWQNSVKVNGLPLTYYGATLPLEAVEQVQLLKGSSGFLYGVGAPGGIVNYLTKRPTDETLVNLSVGYRSDTLFSQHLDVGGRVAKNGFGYRINLVNEQGETYADSDVNRQAVTANFEVPITDNLKWITDLLYQDSDIKRPEPLFSLIATGANPYHADRLPEPIDSTRRLASEQVFDNSKFISGTTGLVWGISDGWDLSVNYGKTHSDYRFPYETIRLTNVDGTYTNQLNDYYDVFDFDFARLLVEGHFNTGRVTHHLTAGASFQDLVLQYATTNYAPQPGQGGNLYDYSPEVWSTVGDTYIDAAKASEYQENAFYLSDTVGFTEKLSLLAGVRFTQYLQQSWDASGGFTGPLTSRYEKDVPTPTVALIYKPAESLTTYLSYVQAVQQGPRAGNTYANAGELLNPIESDQYELGVKLEKPTWALSAAVFRLSKGATYQNSDNYLVQGGEQLYQGAEIGGRVRLGQGWELGSSVVLLDADYTKGVNAWLLDRQLPGTTRFSGAFDVTYDVPALPGLSLHADVKYLDDKVVNQIQANDLTVWAPAFAVANFGGNWVTKVAGRDVAFNAEVRNLFDKSYWEGAFNAFSPGAPRTVAFNARVNF